MSYSYSSVHIDSWTVTFCILAFPPILLVDKDTRIITANKVLICFLHRTIFSGQIFSFILHFNYHLFAYSSVRQKQQIKSLRLYLVFCSLRSTWSAIILSRILSLQLTYTPLFSHCHVFIGDVICITRMAGGRAMTHLVTSYSAYTVCHVTCATNRIRRPPLLAAIFVSTKPFTPHKTQPQRTSMCFQLSILSSSSNLHCADLVRFRPHRQCYEQCWMRAIAEDETAAGSVCQCVRCLLLHFTVLSLFLRLPVSRLRTTIMVYL